MKNILKFILSAILTLLIFSLSSISLNIYIKITYFFIIIILILYLTHRIDQYYKK